MTRPLDPFGAWDNLPSGWTLCPECSLPTTNVRLHQRARSCSGVHTIAEQWQAGRVMVPLSLSVPWGRTGRMISSARGSVIATRRRYAEPPSPDVALWDILLLAAASEPLTLSGQPTLSAIRSAGGHIAYHGRPTLRDQPNLRGFTILCHPQGSSNYASYLRRDEWHTHRFERTDDLNLRALDHSNDERAEAFLAALVGHTSDCSKLKAWWEQPSHRYADPVPYKALWAEVDRYNEWRARDVEPWIIDAWMQVSAGPAEADAWTRAGYTPWEAYLATLFHVYPDNPTDSPYGRPEDWRAIGCDVLEARKWSGVSNQAVRLFLDFRGAQQASGHVNRPFPPRVVTQHMAAGLTYKSALETQKATQYQWPNTQEDQQFRSWWQGFVQAQGWVR